MAAKVPITFAMSPDLLVRIDKLAKATGQSRSAWLEARIRDGLEQEEVGVQALTDPVVGPALLGIFRDGEVLRSMAKMFRDELSDSQLQLFADRVSKLAGTKRRASKASPATQFPPPGRKGKR
jgi:hypothetical protein